VFTLGHTLTRALNILATNALFALSSPREKEREREEEKEQAIKLVHRR